MDDNTFTLDEERLLEDMRGAMEYISRDEKHILLGIVTAVKAMNLINQEREQKNETEKEKKE